MPKISEILYQARTRQLQIPKFQRGWVWSNRQVLRLFESLYNDYPIGSLVVWPTTIDGLRYVDSVIDGQQRLSAFYKVLTGESPPWNPDMIPDSLTDLMFNVETQEFRYRSSAMDDDPLWVSVTALFGRGHPWWSENYGSLLADRSRLHEYHENIARLLNVRERNLHIEKLPADVPPETAAKVFQIVNREGTRVSEGDLVLGQVSLKWEDARRQVMESLDHWRSMGYGISLEWLLHAMCASLGGKINFDLALKASQPELVATFEQVGQETSRVLDVVRDSLGIDSTARAPINNGLIVVVVARLMRQESALHQAERDRALIGWWLLSTLHNRWSADVRNRTNRDIGIVGAGGGVDGLLAELLTMTRSTTLRLSSADFECRRNSKPYYRMLLTLTRRRGARDLRSGLSLSFDQTSEQSQLEVHHLFSRRYLSNAGYDREAIDQLANLAFITKGTNLRIGAKPPTEYLPEYEANNPGVLESQWIPDDRSLWTSDKYHRFLAERRKLLVKESNSFLGQMVGQDL